MREDGSEILEGICNYSVVWQRDNDMERKERSRIRAVQMENIKNINNIT